MREPPFLLFADLTGIGCPSLQIGSARYIAIHSSLITGMRRHEGGCGTPSFFLIFSRLTTPASEGTSCLV